MPLETITGGLGIEGALVSEDGPYEQIFGGLAIEGALASQDGPYERIVGGLAIDSGRQVPLEEVPGGLGIEGLAIWTRTRETITGGLGIEGFAQVTFALETITGGLGIEGSAVEVPLQVVGTNQPIAAATATGVLPMIGSAIFTKWQPKHIKETRIHRHADLHESSGLDDDATRHRWELAVKIHSTLLATHWNFMTAHFGIGKPFYFYDLQNNNFQYDGTGALTTGRYLVRFDTDPIPQRFQKGDQFEIEYSVIEVE